MRNVTCDYLIVGAGFFGSVLAERLANDLDAKIVIIDKRYHVGGNCYSDYDVETGIEFHKYGPHIFHTSSKKVWEYINRFGKFNNYKHRGLTTYQNKTYRMPINLETINSFYNLSLKPREAKKLLLKEIEKAKIKNPKNLEEKAVSLIGWPLYEALIKGYTSKQWGTHPKNLPSKIISRLPVRYNYQKDYFRTAQWQGIPVEGYTRIFEKMLASTRIELILNCDFFENRSRFTVREKIFYTGPIDKYFNYQYGRLGWRSVQLDRALIESDDYQGTSVMNYADAEIKYTRICEPKHFHPEKSHAKGKTIIFYETPKNDDDEPYYPINTEQNCQLYQKYRKFARQDNKTIIGGRLGDYAYYDMDKSILAALQCYETNIFCGKEHSRPCYTSSSLNL
jgi:UDP-galactopyranose mutase